MCADKRLDDFDLLVRRRALLHCAWVGAAVSDRFAAGWVNLHMHSFFSFNSENWSPSHLAWRACEAGLAVAGLVDFDVLDGVEEFLAAGQNLGLRTCVGIESRVFVEAFADDVINSPGEPGIAYHMGVGMPQRVLPKSDEAFLQSLRDTAARRNRELVRRVNDFLAPVTLDYEADVLPLTPDGNATERHICLAYALKAAAHWSGPDRLQRFWMDKLGEPIDAAQQPTGPQLLNLLRAKTMKRGGAGYVQPDARSFPTMAAMNAFVLRAGGIPCVAWLDGTSSGEQKMEALLDHAMATGVAAINIIPDRNYTPGVRDEKLAALQHVIALAEERDLLVLVGTEMNAPGQKFVDDFASAELAPHLPLFLRSAHIVYAHTLLQRYARKGYLSDWACSRFPERRARNEFFAVLGAQVDPRHPESITARATAPR